MLFRALNKVVSISTNVKLVALIAIQTLVVLTNQTPHCIDVSAIPAIMVLVTSVLMMTNVNLEHTTVIQ